MVNLIKFIGKTFFAAFGLIAGMCFLAILVVLVVGLCSPIFAFLSGEYEHFYLGISFVCAVVISAGYNFNEDFM